MTSTEPRPAIDSGENPSDLEDALDVGASAVAGGITGALYSGLVWRLCGRIFWAVMPVDEERPNAASVRLQCKAAKPDRQQRLGSPPGNTCA
jgi:hypothetical protein